MRKRKCSAEVTIDPSVKPAIIDDYHRLTMLDPQTNGVGYIVTKRFPASTMDFVVDKLGQIEDLMDKYGIKNVEELEHLIELAHKY